MKILISDNLSNRGVEILKRHESFVVDKNVGLKPEELRKIVGDYDALIVRSETKVTADIIAAGERLKVIGRAGTGVDNIDVPAATQRGIVVMNAAGGNSVTTAEHTIALLMSLARKVPQAAAKLKAGKWDKKSFMGTELNTKTLGIIGLGNIGKIVASRGQGLGMKVIAYDPFLTRGAAQRHRTGRARRPLPPLGFHHRPHAADRRDARDHQRSRLREDERRRARHQLRARRAGG